MTRAPALLPLLLLLPLPATAGGEPRAVDVICRAGWGGRAATRPYVKHTIVRLTVHHSGMLLRQNRAAPGRIRSAQRFHQSRGWPDIAYHYLIDLEGNIYEGRPTSARGDTGTRYDTTGHLLVCVVGNYDRQKPRPGQVRALADLLAWASARFKVGAETIRGHLQLARTKCPGRKLQKLITDGTLRAEVEARLEAGGIKLRLVCGEQARRLRAEGRSAATPRAGAERPKRLRAEGRSAATPRAGAERPTGLRAIRRRAHAR